VVGRHDLPPGLRVAQMFHALRRFASEHPYIEDRWYRESNTIVLLEIDGEDITALAERARARNLTMSEFSEPGVANGAVTAIAFGPDAERLLSSLPLALREAHEPSESQTG